MMRKVVLAKAFERRRDLKERSTLVLPAPSKEKSTNEKLCLKKRVQLLEQSVPHEKRIFRNLVLYNDGVEVAIEDPVNES